MNARKPNFKISIAGKNVTSALTKYVSSLTYTDRVAGQSDEIELVLINSDGRFSDEWQPTTNDKIDVSIGYDDDLTACGTFTIDTVESSGPPSTVSVKALAAGTNSPLRTRKTVAHEGKTIREIAQVTVDALNAADPTADPQWTINDGTSFSHREKVDWTTERATLSKAAGSIRAVLLMLGSPQAPLAFATAIGAAYDQYQPILAAAQSMTTKGRSEDGTEIRQTATLWAKAWQYKKFPEAKKSIQIATAFADKLTDTAATLTDIDKTVTRSKLDIKTTWEAQTDEDDLAYLSRIARKYGILCSVRGTVITFTSIYDVEAANPADTIQSGAFKLYRFSQSTIKQYAGAEVKWHDPETGEAVVSRYAATDPPSSALPGSVSEFEPVASFGDGDVLRIHERAETKAQADEIAKAAIHGRSSREFEGEITVEGRQLLCAGCNVDLVESEGLKVLGRFAGRWAIVESRHTLVPGSGYVTTLKIKRGK